MEKKKPKKKNQLASGNYRILAYDYTDAAGKKHYKSFTAPTKKEAKMMADRWKIDRSHEEPEDEQEHLTVYDAIGKYMDVKSGVLSPSTIRGYTGIRKQYFSGSFGQKDLLTLTNPAVQVWISELSSRLSPKTVRNAYGLLSATMDMFSPDIHLKVTLPQKKKPELYCPNDDDVKKLLEHIKGTELEIAVLLAAFGPLRRGEICALTSDDIEGTTIRVSKSMVKGPDKEWYIKQPKTFGSYRDIDMPDFVIKRIAGIKGPVVKMNPDYLTHRFGRVLKLIDVPHFRFHDLRHYAASIMHAIGVPDQYILTRGGWASDNVMKTVYRNTIDLEAVRQTKKINHHFSKLKSV